MYRVGIEQWEEPDDLERAIVAYMASYAQVRTKEVAVAVGISYQTVNKRLKGLMDKKIVVAYGRVNSPARVYYQAE